ncbi:MAG TPA: OmpA family protein, partial [Candidatus Binataceae bacterium]|nr:OmpA family protein [Candidatus Binataceae bacterium]
MREWSYVCSALIVSSLLIFTSSAFSQTVNDLTGQAVTPEKLISVLTPKESPPAEKTGATRGLSFIAPACKHYRKAAERGIELTPKADIAALTVEFPSGSSRITRSDEEVLNSVAEALNSATLKPCCFEIQGYTDSVGKASYNERLSQRRAEAVVRYLAEHNSID